MQHGLLLAQAVVEVDEAVHSAAADGQIGEQATPKSGCLPVGYGQGLGKRRSRGVAAFEFGVQEVDRVEVQLQSLQGSSAAWQWVRSQVLPGGVAREHQGALLASLADQPQQGLPRCGTAQLGASLAALLVRLSALFVLLAAGGDADLARSANAAGQP
ncbi:hypothetical protein BGM19_37935 [Streptomyces agglomeratus]|nr:hypothetical protein BGK72_36990 [Streptomyces agglomeratus]OEJ56460.1 hypothetical protein BGM19_37935 [Streptomyces agglomeratus]